MDSTNTPKRSVKRHSITANEFPTLEAAREAMRAKIERTNQTILANKGIPSTNKTPNPPPSSPEGAKKVMTEKMAELQAMFAQHGQRLEIIDSTPQQVENGASEQQIEIELQTLPKEKLQQKFRVSPNIRRPIVRAPIKKVVAPPAPVEKLQEDDDNNYEDESILATMTQAESLNIDSMNTRIKQPLPKKALHGQRINFPSNNAYYGDISIEVRQLDIPLIAKIHVAKVNQDETAFFDVMNETLTNFDVRALTLPDFRFLMYWHKLNSLTSSPYKLRYTTMYGNEGTFTVTKMNLQQRYLDFNEQIYAHYDSLGLCVPIVADQEEYNALVLAGSLTEEDIFLYQKAAYVKGDSVREKIDNLKNNFTADDLFYTIPNFIKAFDDYGVLEYIEVSDENFDANEAIDYLEKQLDSIKLMLNSEKTIDADLANYLTSRSLELSDEINRIKNELELGEAAPLCETKEFSLGMNDFFPFNT